MNRNWKDKRNKTLKLIFCIPCTELVYNQDKKCTSPSKENISIYLKKRENRLVTSDQEGESSFINQDTSIDVLPG